MTPGFKGMHSGPTYRGVGNLIQRRESEKRAAAFMLNLSVRGLPFPEREFRFHKTRKWRMDFAWPDRLVALEVEGGVFTKGRHVRGKGYAKDMEKYNAAVLAGWKLIRVQPRELCTPTTLDTLTRLLTPDPRNPRAEIEVDKLP